MSKTYEMLSVMIMFAMFVMALVTLIITITRLN